MRRVLLLLLAGIAGFLIWFVFKSYTWPIWTENGIAELEAVEINGERQWLLLRGEDRDAPVLFFLHGGPGMPAMYLGHAFQRPLEKDFVVVHWDQRGAGKSFRPNVDPATLSTSQLIRDAEVVIDHVQKKLGAKRVFLVGHSHGSYVGVLLAQERPDLVAAYVGVGQMADDARPVQDAFLRSKLKELRLPADTVIDGRNREDLLFQTRSELVGATSPLPLILTGLMSTEYSLFDALNVPMGPQLYTKYMKYDLVQRALTNEVTAFDVPVYFALGAADMVTPVSQARDYFGKLIAPKKRWYAFERSAHFPFYEEPERFAEVMREIKAEIGDAVRKDVPARSGTSWTDGRFSGYITFGCGDSFVHAPGGETWFVNLTDHQRNELFRRAKVSLDKYFPWATRYVVLEGVRKDAPRPGFFGVHPRQLDVTSVLFGRDLEFGESTNAATQSRPYSGYVLVGPESYGFVPLQQSDEFWSVVPGKVGWDKLYERFQPPPDLVKNARMYNALVELTGRVGPPGAYAHMGDFNREIAVDTFVYVRASDANEMDGTAGVVDPDVPNSGVARINRCIAPGTK